MADLTLLWADVASNIAPLWVYECNILLVYCIEYVLYAINIQWVEHLIEVDDTTGMLKIKHRFLVYLMHCLIDQ